MARDQDVRAKAVHVKRLNTSTQVLGYFYYLNKPEYEYAGYFYYLNKPCTGGSRGSHSHRVRGCDAGFREGSKASRERRKTGPIMP